MARLKRNSSVLETARQRLAGLKSIKPTPNFGPALDLVEYEQEIEALETKLSEYGDTLTLADRQANEVDALEVKLREKNRRMLAATEASYGPNSDEYMIAGGTRTDDYKSKPKSKKKPGGDDKP
jgi:hypothetical protein